ncbi:hypothetical protein SAMN02746089_01437 [Caldanaerobius fijiensis DSM 17918]|uniref:TOBE domain-containing protein n=1 Tax=Caldanaerobius fijiensis DSM 17918 TaxID=1121256 RepID=A0A1M4ZKU5_9THEO|nr:hypothetical protein [Caldanaerobius fijiensis]SHF18679.1 hypothetical protein SAMN02746089_01437 [Caldanaerobius fijiensis DSM 17918]
MISTGLFQLRAIKRREYIDRDIIACIRNDHLQVFTSPVENSCECAVVDIIKGVFSETFLVKCGKWMFQVELPKEKSQELKNLKNRTFYLHFPFDKIILLSKED